MAGEEVKGVPLQSLGMMASMSCYDGRGRLRCEYCKKKPPRDEWFSGTMHGRGIIIDCAPRCHVCEEKRRIKDGK